MIGLTSILVALATVTPIQLTDRSLEGDWSLVDQTDNNTGKREVYAMSIYIDREAFVSLYLRCWEGRPTFFIEWADISLPDQAVITIAPTIEQGAQPVAQRYVFEKTKDIVDRGMRASPEDSARIVAAIGTAEYARLSAHLSGGAPTISMGVAGTPRAWARVSRHCPVKTVPLPPL